jgi:hypothetical protein
MEGQLLESWALSSLQLRMELGQGCKPKLLGPHMLLGMLRVLLGHLG